MRILPFMLLALSACSTSSSDQYPALTPLGTLYAQAQDGSQIEAATRSLQARAAQLRRKAAALRGYSIEDGQDRLKQL